MYRERRRAPTAARRPVRAFKDRNRYRYSLFWSKFGSVTPRLLALAHEKSLLLLGPRGTGKSTWVREVVRPDVLVDLLSGDRYARLLARPSDLEALLVPGVRTDARTGDKTFFNSVVAAYSGWNDCRNEGSRAVMLGDGTFCGEQEMLNAQAIMSEIEVAFPWQRGDVLLLDNRTVMHSRQPFTGPRRILASLSRDSHR